MGERSGAARYGSMSDSIAVGHAIVSLSSSMSVLSRAWSFEWTRWCASNAHPASTVASMVVTPVADAESHWYRGPWSDLMASTHSVDLKEVTVSADPRSGAW